MQVTTHTDKFPGGLDVVYREIESLKRFDRNARTHTLKQIEAIARSIETFGFTNPILIDGGGRILAGHGRVRAAKTLGMTRVPTIRLDHLTEAQLRAYVLADNKLAEKAGWDRELLAIELQHITELDVSFDLGLTGFETAEIDLMFDDLAANKDDQADALPEADPNATPVSRPGDLWLLGPHRLLCADATQASSFDHLMEGRKAQMVVIDPPYNVSIDGHVCGLGKVKHAEFAMASGEMSEAEFTAFLANAFRNLADHSVDGSIHHVFMDWRHLFEALSAGRAVYAELKNLCVWNKTNGGMGSLYRSRHELVLVYKNGTAAHINNVELGKHGRYRTNVWSYPGINTFRPDRRDELSMHPTVKPVGLVADAIKDCSKRGDIVLDTFAGSGTTIIACEKTGRRAFAMEIDPKYVDVAVRRWQDYTGQDAVHEETGSSFAEVAARRQDAGDGPQAEDGSARTDKEDEDGK